MGKIIVPATAVCGECSSCHSLLVQAGRGKVLKLPTLFCKKKKEIWCCSHYPKSAFCNKNGPVQEQLLPVAGSSFFGVGSSILSDGRNAKVSDIFNRLEPRQKYLFVHGNYSAGIGVWEGAVVPEKQKCVLGVQVGSK